MADPTAFWDDAAGIAGLLRVPSALWTTGGNYAAHVHLGLGLTLMEAHFRILTPLVWLGTTGRF